MVPSLIQMRAIYNFFFFLGRGNTLSYFFMIFENARIFKKLYHSKQNDLLHSFERKASKSIQPNLIINYHIVPVVL